MIMAMRMSVLVLLVMIIMMLIANNTAAAADEVFDGHDKDGNDKDYLSRYIIQ